MSTSTPEIYAIDFGTSNSLLTAANRDTVTEPIPLDPTSREPTILRSILFFSESSEWFFGAEGLDEYVARGMRGRFMRSVKRFLPMKSFNDTQLGRRRVKLEELVGIFLREIRTRANRHFDADVRRVLLGRPARFSDDAESDKLAQDRLERAARFAGFEEVHFCPEPVAAAYDFQRASTGPTNILVADLGGGTSDFTVARLGGKDAIDVLAIGGLSIAGDVLDGSIMRHKVAKHFASEVTYQVPFGNNVLTMPRSLIERLCSPADLCLLDRRDVLEFIRNVRAGSLGEGDKEYIDQLLCLIEDALGFRVFEAIETTKRALSSDARAEFVFEYPDVDIRETIERVEFERFIADPVDKIVGRLASTLEASGLAAGQIDVVCSTGGTARVPLVAERLEALFGSTKMQTLSSFHAVIHGLGQRARELVNQA